MINLQSDIAAMMAGQAAAADASADTGVQGVHEGVEMLKDLSLNDLISGLAQKLVNFAINVAIAIVVFYVGKFVINRIYKFVASIMIRRKVDNSLATFVLSFVRIVLYFILIVTVIGIIGIETSSFLALFASAGVAIGMALSGTLQNFAGGVLILLLKPYKVGDYIEAQGFAGTVREIQIFHTLIGTPDNKAILIPNGALSTTSINNWSREEFRRVTWSVAISYGDSVEVARKAILEMFAGDHRIVKEFIDEDGDGYDDNTGELIPVEEPKEPEPEPEPAGFWKRIFQRKVSRAIKKLEEKQQAEIKALKPKVTYAPSVVVNALADSSVELSVRVWVRCENFWSVFYDYNEKIYTELPSHGVSFPFPQMDVYVKEKK